MKKNVLFALIAALALTSVMFGLRARNTRQDLNAPTPLPSIEAEKSAAPRKARGDGGALSREEFLAAQERIENRSTRYVVTDITDAKTVLPITGTNAVIGVFSENAAQVELRAPNGQVMALRPVQTDDLFEGAMNREIIGQGKFEATPVQALTQPGGYTLTKQGSGKVTVVVNDDNDLTLRTWFSNNGVGKDEKIELRAFVQNGEKIEPATVTATVYAEDRQTSRTVPLKKDADGTYFLAFQPQALNVLGRFTLGRTAKVVVDAEGATSTGQAFKRTGYLELISGVSQARLVQVLNETLTTENLEIPVSVRVTGEGRFHLRADLVTKDGEPVAWAQDAANLTPGNNTLTLRFDRSVIPAGKEFVVRNIELTDVSDIPGIKSPRSIGDYAVKSKL